MTSPAHPAGRRALLAHARWVDGLAFLYVLFILQATLIPFDFGGTDAAGDSGGGGAALVRCADFPARHFFIVTTGASYWPDTVGNVFLYLPLGLLLHWSLSRADRLRSALARSILWAGLISVATEWVQGYSPSRVSSAVDVAANVGGATLGCVMSWSGRWSTPRFLGQLFRECRVHPRESAVVAYLLGLACFEMIPFAPMLGGTRLAAAWRTATVVPFAEDAALAERARSAAERGDEDDLALQRLTRMKLWTRWCAEAAAFAVLAWLVQAALREEYRFERRATNALTWWIGGGVALLISLLQFPLHGRGFHGTDVLMRWLGLSVGLFVRWAWLDRPGRSPHQGAALTPAQRRAWARWALAAVVVYVVVNGLIPFMVDTRDGLVRRALSAAEFLPFMAYFTARFDVAMDDLMTKSASFALLAALLAQCWTRFDGRTLPVRVGAVVAAGVALSLLIETAQILIRGRTPSLTDPMIAGAACWFGVVAHFRLARFFSRAAATRAAVSQTPSRQTGWTLTDELVAELMEEHAGAPPEAPPAVPAPDSS